MNAILLTVLPGIGLLVLAIHDRLQSKRPELRVYPIVRRLLAARRQRGSEGDSGYPFRPDDLREIRARALTGSATRSFGMARPPDDALVDLTLIPQEPESAELVRVGQSTIPLLNFGALGFGPVSGNTILAVSNAARTVDCLQNTGEDGVTRLHLTGSARLIWQIGTGYWGCRDTDGTFSEQAFCDAVANPSIELIEIKLSQGAKPGAGGFLPAAKNGPGVARILGVEPYTDVISPPAHSAFYSPETMLEWLGRIADLAGKPVGIKLCIGSRRTVNDLVQAIELTGITPDFVTVDGGEGGSGAAPDDLQRYAGAPVHYAVQAMHDRLSEAGYRDRVRLLAAGRVHTGYDLFRLVCEGANGCFFTRAPMIAMGCVQARRCHTGSCPSGIATQHWWRRGAINPETQGEQLARYYRTIVDGYRHLLRASGRRNAGQLDLSCLVYHKESRPSRPTNREAYHD